MASTMLLDTVAWDLVLNAQGDIALATEPYSLAQDAASAIRTFLGEVFWNVLVGVPYNRILGQNPPLSYLKQQIADAALTVPGVATATVYITSTANRCVSGQVQIVSTAGKRSVANFSTPAFQPVNPQGVG